MMVSPSFVLFELVPGGSLLSFLRKNNTTLTTKQLFGMCRDAAAGNLLAIRYNRHKLSFRIQTKHIDVEREIF